MSSIFLGGSGNCIFAPKVIVYQKIFEFPKANVYKQKSHEVFKNYKPVFLKGGVLDVDS
jgi:hypothetical protein